MKKILVIGGAGYIGQVVIDELLKKKKYKIVCIDNLLYGKVKNIDFYKENKDFKFIKSDFTNLKIIKNLFDIGFKDVIFLAALVGDPISKKYPNLSNKIMFNNTKKFIQICKKNKVDSFLFASTCSNYGLSNSKKLLNENAKLRPLSIYEKNKVKIEKYLLSLKKLNFTISRFSTAFGLSGRMRFDLTVNEFIKVLFFNKELLVYDQHTYRPYLHTKDFARLFYILLNKKNKIAGKVYNVGSNNNNYSKKTILQRIQKFVKNKKIKFKKFGNDPRNYRVNFNKIKKDLNFRPRYTINYGIIEIINFLKNSKLSYSKLSKMGNYIIKNET